LAIDVNAKTVSIESSLKNNSTRDILNLKDRHGHELIARKQADARETRWSYFYIGRWAWHLPLWFLVWFVFYLVFCTFRSIYSHAVRNEFIHFVNQN
jgi:hypothetical protein